MCDNDLDPQSESLFYRDMQPISIIIIIYTCSRRYHNFIHTNRINCYALTWKKYVMSYMSWKPVCLNDGVSKAYLFPDFDLYATYRRLAYKLYWSFRYRNANKKLCLFASTLAYVNQLDYVDLVIYWQLFGLSGDVIYDTKNYATDIISFVILITE